MRVDGELKINKIREYVGEIFQKEVHKKRQESLADAAFGLLNSDSLRVHQLGEGLARGKGLSKKHATKQIDRLLSNDKLSMWDIYASWIPYILGDRKHIQIAIDWTSFANDKQDTICINLLTTHGRATPLLWQTVKHSRLKNNRARFEDQLLSRLKDCLPAGVRVMVLADRGFASQKFFSFIEKELGFEYLIRIQATTTVISNKNTAKKAIEWLAPNGRARNIKQAKLTKEQLTVEQVVICKDKDMKVPWLLATNNKNLKTREIINLYGKRWKIEPYFRDIKDQRYGFGLSSTHISSPERRDRLLLIVALAYTLLTLLGAAGESIGFDRLLKVNTVKTRTHSLIRQGMFYYDFFNNFKPDDKIKLLDEFNKLLEQQRIWEGILFAI
jgi:hypothetical protein